MEATKKYPSVIFDAFCLVSLIGIWPRFIAPNRLQVNHVTIPIADLPSALEKFTILQFSDLHMGASSRDRLLQKVLKIKDELKPHLIVCTGDFLCHGHLGEKKKLQNFLSSFTAPFGCFAILGNHDYSRWISTNLQGDYDVVTRQGHPIFRGLKRLFNPPKLSGKITKEAQKPPFNEELIHLIRQTPFQLLHNATHSVPIRKTHLNICGLGDYMTAHLDPVTAFADYNTTYPGVVLTHNPDSIPLLTPYPGELILCGHTHGAQINIPFLRNRITLIEDQKYTRGLLRENGKWIYINRGIGSSPVLRFFSKPEITLFTLESKK